MVGVARARGAAGAAAAAPAAARGRALLPPRDRSVAVAAHAARAASVARAAPGDRDRRDDRGRGPRLALALADEYSEQFGRIGGDLYASAYPHLAEVRRPTTLTVSTAGMPGDATCEWAAEDASGAWSAVATGNPVELTFEAVGKHAVTAKCTSSGAWSASEAFVVVAKYVRRELRELSPADRERFFAALHAVYRVGQAEGERAYLRPSRG